MTRHWNLICTNNNSYYTVNSQFQALTLNFTGVPTLVVPAVPKPPCIKVIKSCQCKRCAKLLKLSANTKSISKASATPMQAKHSFSQSNFAQSTKLYIFWVYCIFWSVAQKIHNFFFFLDLRNRRSFQVIPNKCRKQKIPVNPPVTAAVPPPNNEVCFCWVVPNKLVPAWVDVPLNREPEKWIQKKSVNS